MTAQVAGQGDLYAAIVAMVDRHYGRLFGYLYRLMDDRDWAEDLTQEAFVRAFKARRQLPQVANPRAWLYRIATNLALTDLKRRRRFTWLSWSAAEGEGISQPDVAESVEQRSAVEQALAALPVEYRAPLLLRYQYDFSVPEVAEALHISPAAARKRLYRARERLREALFDETEGSR